MGYISEPLSRYQLRHLALQLRQMLNITEVLYFPVLQFLEQVMPILFEGFSYEIVEKDAFPEKKHADTDVANRVIRIREDVYYGAVKGNGRDRMTVMHEIAHYLLMVVCGVRFNRSFEGTQIISYRDPEWQAKALAGEIMCPADAIAHMTPPEVAEKCGVSIKAAEYNLGLGKGGGVH